MADDFEQQEWVKFGVAATLSKQYAADQREFLDLLAKMLNGVLGTETEIAWRGGLFSKKTVQRITVTLGDNRYSLEDPGRGPLQAARVRVVRGIALKTEPMAVQDWVSELSEALDARVQSSAAAREALAKLLN